MTGDTNTPGWDAASRHRKTRRYQRFGKAAEISETRNETKEVDDVSGRDMQVNGLLNRQAVGVANLGEIGAKCSAITDGDFPTPRLGQADFVEAVKVRTKTCLDFVMPQLEGIELDQDRAIGRMKIDNAADRLQFEQAKQLGDLLISDQRNVVIEINEQRIITCGQKLRSTVYRCGHPGEL